MTVLPDMFEEISSQFNGSENKIVCLQKFGSLWGSTSASLKVGGILAIHKKTGKFLTLGIALILLYLLADLLLKYKQNWL